MAMASGASMKTLMRDTVIYGIGNFSSLIISFLLIPVLTRTLSPEGYGILALANVLIVLASNIFGLGMGSSIFNELLHSPETHIKKIIGSTLLLILYSISGCVLAASAIYFFASHFIAGVFTKEIYLYMALSTCAGIVTPVIFSIFRARNHAGTFCFLSIAGGIATFIFTLCFLTVYHEGVAGVLKARAFTGILIFIAAFTVLRRNIEFSTHYMKKLLSFGIPLIPSSLMMWVLDLSDRFFIQAYRGTHEVGIYSLGYQYASILSFPLIAFQLAWPQMLVVYSKERDGTVIVGRIFKYYVLFAFSAALFLISFSKEFMAILGTSSFEGARNVIVPVVLGYIFYGIYLLGAAGIYLTKDSRWMPWITLSGCLVNILGNVLFVPSYGMMAAAYATLISYAAMAIFMWLNVRQIYPVAWTVKDTLKIFLLLPGMFLTARFEDSFFGIRLGLFMWIAAFGFILMFLRKPATITNTP